MYYSDQINQSVCENPHWYRAKYEKFNQLHVLVFSANQANRHNFDPLEPGTSLSADPNIASCYEGSVSILERLLDKIFIVSGACLRDSRDQRNLDQAILANGDKTIESYGS